MDRGAWWATVQRVAESDTTEHTQHIYIYHVQTWGLENSTPLEGLTYLETFFPAFKDGFALWCIEEPAALVFYHLSVVPWLPKHGPAPSFSKYTLEQCHRKRCGVMERPSIWPEMIWAQIPASPLRRPPHALRIITLTHPIPQGLLWGSMWSFTWKCFANYGALFSCQLLFHKS